MKKMMLALLVCCALAFDMQAQSDNYKVVTVVESIVPGGVGRSRMVEQKTPMDVDAFTTERTDGKRSKMRNIRRGDAKIERFDETKLLNFYSGVGINFQNIASNDALIASKINKLAAEGWQLKFVTSGVESNAGSNDGKGIFITRLIFTK